jgi:hypothetical protein
MVTYAFLLLTGLRLLACMDAKGGIMKNKMPSPLLDEKIMLYKVTSKYTAKFLAGHYDLLYTYKSLKYSNWD